MGEEPDSPLGATEDRSANTRESNDDRNGNTRRTFLGGAIGGTLAGAVGLGTAGTAAGQVTADQFTVECDYVELTDASGIDSIRVECRDGSYVESVNGVFLDDDETMPLGSPGRAVESVVVNGEQTFDSFDTCQPPQRRQTTFTATGVHLRPTEFIVNGWVPSSLTSAVYLHFADGTTETAQGYSTGSDGTLDRFPEFEGLLTVEGVGGVTNRYCGTGDNAGKVIEAVRIETDVDYRRFHLVSDVADAALLGTESAQERPIEIVGASQGAVEYELTATGPIRPLRVNDRIGAGSNDTISQNDDGTWTVAGYTGNTGYGDAYVVNGRITDISRTGGDGEYVVRELERRLLDASAESSDGESDDDGHLTDEFATVYERKLGVYRDALDERGALAGLFDAGPDAVAFQDRDYPAIAIDGRIRKWPSEAALLADLGTDAALDEWTDDWTDVPVEQRQSLRKGLRAFVEGCPACGGDLTASPETVESCCGIHQVIAVSCGDCGDRLREIDPDQEDAKLTR